MSDSISSHSANIIYSDDDDLTSGQEYSIAALVILLFGLLYWLFNGGWKPEPLADQTPPHLIPVSSLKADTSSTQLPTSESDTEANASPVTATQSTNTMSSTTLSPATTTGSKTDRIDIQANTTPTSTAKAETKKTLTGLTNDQINTFNTTEKALKQAQAVIANAKLKEASQKDKDLAPKKEQANTHTSSGKQTYRLPDGTEVTLANDGFEQKLKSAIENKTIGKPIIFDKIYFKSGSADIDTKSNHQLRATAALLHTYPDSRILIRGHTDNTGNAVANNQLSLSRANAMGLALIDLGIDGDRIRVLGVGAAEPIASNATPKGRNKNRRIEIVLTH